MSVINLHTLQHKLEELAKKEIWTDDDDYNPCEYSGYNFDDAFRGGREAGEVELARELLREWFGIKDFFDG